MHKRYGPYYIYPEYQKCLKFGEQRSFELLIAAYRDPRVTPEREQARGMGNGIAIVYHDAQHEVLVLDGHHSANQVRLTGPLDTQIAEFNRIAGLGWSDFVGFCLANPRIRQRWHAPSTWDALAVEYPQIASSQQALPLRRSLVRARMAR